MMAKIQPNNYILKINPYKPGKPIEEVQREFGLKNVIKLASNENSFGTSPMVFEALKKALKDINRYPDGSCFYLRKELSQFLNVKSDELIFGNGSDEIIILLLRSFVKPQDEVIVCEPTFLMYGISATTCDAKIVNAPLKYFEYDIEAVKKKVTDRTRIIFLASPNNPTGTYINKSDLEDLLKNAREDVIVFLDEAYIDFVDASDYPNSLDLRKKYRNLVLTRTFSKAYGLAGLRIGYGIADSLMVDCMNKVRDPFNINFLAQVAAQAALKDRVFIKEVKKLILEGKRYLYKELDRLNLKYVKGQANFVLIDLGRDAKPLAEKLMLEGVIVRGMKEWGLNNCIRVTIGKPEENVRFIKTLKECLK